MIDVSPIFLPPFLDVHLLKYDRCQRFVKYEGAFTTVSLGIVGLMMIIRIHALYGGSRGVTLFVAALLMAQVGVQAWLLANAIRKSPFLDET